MALRAKFARTDARELNLASPLSAMLTMRPKLLVLERARPRRTMQGRAGGGGQDSGRGRGRESGRESERRASGMAFKGPRDRLVRGLIPVQY
jgi:hypothetical protein